MAGTNRTNTPEPTGEESLIDAPADEQAPVTLPPELAERYVVETAEPTPDQIAVIRVTAGAIADAATQVAQLPNSRERSLALTHLEEAQMWANKAVFA